MVSLSEVAYQITMSVPYSTAPQLHGCIVILLIINLYLHIHIHTYAHTHTHTCIIVCIYTDWFPHFISIIQTLALEII